jgi:hypothetical protein
MEFQTITPPLDPRVRKVKRFVLTLAALVVFSLITAATMATIHLATDRPVKEVLGFGKGEG